MGKVRLLFAITQFFKGGAEIALLNLFRSLDGDRYEIDFVMLNQLDIPNTISLATRVPEWVNVVDAVHLLSNGAPITEAPDPEQLKTVLRGAVGHKHYNWAFHIGEWSSPEFVATGVWADHKAAWIHNDLNIAEYFDGDAFFKWDAWYECYLFVSENSLTQSAKKYPQLLTKGVCVHNLLDAPSILALCKEPLGEDEQYFARELPIVVTCANVRPQKNHLRQAEAMALLRQKGFDFLWLNVGTIPGDTLTVAVRAKIDELGLADRFLLLGNRSNPYPYMARANAVAVLSDYESWSMVISEALMLGAPVIATKTSGALAQITPENGLLADFSVDSIAEGLERILTQYWPRPALDAEIPRQRGLAEFETLVRPAGANRLLYVMGDADCTTGKRQAAFSQMEALMRDADLTVSLPALAEPEVLAQCPCRRFFQPDAHQRVPWFYLARENVLEGDFPPEEKRRKRRQAWAIRFGLGASFEKRVQRESLQAALEGFSAVIAPSAESRDDFAARHTFPADNITITPPQPHN